MISDSCALLLGLLLTVAACSRTDQPSATLASDDLPKFKIVTRRDDDRVVVQVEKQHVVLAFHSPVGISEATIAREGEEWPKSMKVRLHLPGLEQFSLVQGDVKIEGAVSSQDGSVRVWLTGQEDQPLKEAHPLWIKVRRLDEAGQPTTGQPCRDGSIELQLPQAFLTDNPSTFKLGWIDFYRN